MTDETTPPPPTVYGTAVRKFLFLGGVFFIVWLVFGRVLPTFLFPAKKELPAQQVTLPETTAVPVAPVPPVLSPGPEVPVAPVVTQPVQPPAEGDAKIAALQARLNKLETDSADNDELPRLQSELGGQKKTIEALQAELHAMQAHNTRQLASLVALNQMHDALLRGEPFREPWKRLEAATADQPAAQTALATLAPYTDTGAPTLSVLQKDFQGAITQALNPESDGSILNNLRSLIRIRKVGSHQQGNDDEAVLARAEAKLSSGDIADALQETAKLSPQAAPQLAEWKKEAEHHLAAQDAMHALDLALTEPPAQ